MLFIKLEIQKLSQLRQAVDILGIEFQIASSFCTFFAIFLLTKNTRIKNSALDFMDNLIAAKFC